MEQGIQTKGKCSVTTARLQEQALCSAAFLLAAIEDKRFGSSRISDELRDAIEILRGELDELGMIAEYKQEDGSLVAWPPGEDGNISAVLRKASFVDDKPSEPGYMRGVSML
jgi:hypothetical protein